MKRAPQRSVLSLACALALFDGLWTTSRLPGQTTARASVLSPAQIAPPDEPPPQAQMEETPKPVKPSAVLVVQNRKSEDSVAIASYYVRKRKIPMDHLLTVTCPDVEECSLKEFREQIREPVKAYIESHKLPIEFIVLTKGIPIRTHEGESGGFCVDSLLAMMDWTLIATRINNPYFGKKERFRHKKYNFYLVTRLDGYTRADCLRLVDNAIAAKPSRGPILLDIAPGRDNPSYREPNDGMRRANSLLNERGIGTVLGKEESFLGGYKSLAGYFSWGSNDAKYSRPAYNSVDFVPGALAETVVSTSGRTFKDPKAPGQSLIADLIAQGVTGCKGYVSEPFVDSIAHADILFDRYTGGYTLAESFYMASRYLYWKDIVIGDPLCAPYAAK